MARGFIYTDTDILKTFESRGELTVDELAGLMEMSRSAVYPRVAKLHKAGKLQVTRELSNGSGRPSKVYGITGKHRPSIMDESGTHIVVNKVPVTYDIFPHMLNLLKENVTSLSDIDPENRKNLWRSLTFPVLARTIMLLRSREHKTQYLAQRDALVKEGEELVAFLKERIDAIESTIYSPEFRDPYESNFTNLMEDYHQWGYDHLVEYKPIVFSEAVREAYDSAHILNTDTE